MPPPPTPAPAGEDHLYLISRSSLGDYLTFMTSYPVGAADADRKQLADEWLAADRLMEQFRRDEPDWADVGPEFRDNIGDTVHRNHPGWGTAGPYVDNTGRNDIGTTMTYVRAEIQEIATALAALTGEPHPLADPGTATHDHLPVPNPGSA